MAQKKDSDFVPSRAHAPLTTGEVIKMLRELKGWTQEKLSELSGISTTNISLLENGKVEIGKKRAVKLANAFGLHPAIIMFPEYERNERKKAA